MAYNPLILGQQPMSSSQGVVIASNQTPVSVAGTVNVGNTVTINPASVSGTIGASVIGSVPTTQAGTWISSIVSTVPSSVLVGASIFGTAPVTQVTSPWIITGSVQGAFSPSGNQSVSGTVTANQGGNAGLASSWPVKISNGTQTADVSASSMLSVAVNNMPSVVAVQGGTVITSVVGGYAGNSTHLIADPGLFSLGVRNDTLSSVTSADLDYSQLSVGPSGEVVTANAPLTKWVSGKASVFYGVTQPVVAGQGTSVFTYITSLQVVNVSANNVYVSFLDSAGGTILGYAAAPANGGSNIIIPNGMKTLANGAFHASVSGVASVYLSAQGFISKS